MIPDGGIRGDFQETLSPVVPERLLLGSRGIWALEPLQQGGQPCPFKARTSPLAGLPWGSSLIQGRIQT